MKKTISVALLLVMVLSMCLTLVSCGVSGKTYKLDSVELIWDEDTNDTIKSGTMALVTATLNATEDYKISGNPGEAEKLEMYAKMLYDTLTDKGEKAPCVIFNKDGSYGVKANEDAQAENFGSWEKTNGLILVKSHGIEVASFKAKLFGGLSEEEDVVGFKGLRIVKNYKKA
jgi:hypothetical protein